MASERERRSYKGESVWPVFIVSHLSPVRSPVAGGSFIYPSSFVVLVVVVVVVVLVPIQLTPTAGLPFFFRYLQGSKKYFARGEFGYETTTLDVEGNVTKTADFDHITIDKLKETIPNFVGTLQQIPPIFSAIKQGGKRLYNEAREGKTAEDVEIQPREVHVYNLDLLNEEKTDLPFFDIDIECGGGTYVRSLVRDIGYSLDSVATTTILTRTKQGQFTIDDVLDKPDWTPDNIYGAIDKQNKIREVAEGADTDDKA